MYILFGGHRLLQHGRLLIALQTEAILALFLQQEKRVYLGVIFLKEKCLKSLHTGPEGSLGQLLIIVRLSVTLITERID